MVEATAIKKGLALNYKSKINIFATFCLIFAFILKDKAAEYPYWWTYCCITAVLVKIGIYDIFLSKFRGLGFFDETESDITPYEIFLHKIRLHIIDVRVVSFALCIFWLFTHQYLL